MMYGVTKDGFNRKTYNDVISDMENRAKELFGEDINLMETNPMAMTFQNMGWEISSLWELAEDVYNSAFVDTSEDSSLDGVGKYIGTNRKPSQHSKGVITIEGSKDVKIPKGFRISTESTEVVFETTTTKIIEESGKVEIPIKSIDTGMENNLPSMTLTKVVNPISGVSKIYNENTTTDGLDVEKDKEFRERYYRSINLGGSSTRESVEAALLNLADVTDAFVEENDTIEVKEGVPPKALAPYVFGGVDEVIVKTILLSKAGGIRSFGEIETEIEDSKGIKHIIGFTRPTVKDIYIKLDISKGLGFPGEDIVKTAILNYVGGTDENDIVYKGLKLGENVVIAKLISSVMCLNGIDDISTTISFDNIDYVDTNLAIGKKEIARTTFDKVVINYV